jgi:AraC-like DNA-binding protein
VRGPEPVIVLSPSLALTAARTQGVRLFSRCPPVHSVLLGPCQLDVAGRTLYSPGAIALPANQPHTLLALPGAFAGVAYLDARRYSFADAQRLADSWRSFVPGSDDLREAFGDAQALPQRRVDPRVLRALEALELADMSVPEAAAHVGLSDSRLTHLMAAELGAPPRTWRTWFRLRRALREAMFGGKNLTQAAHHAGFADSAHLTRTCKQLMGVRPAQMMPQTIYIAQDS